MKLLEERIQKDGQTLGKDILKVDSFLTHQVDSKLMKAIGQRFADLYQSCGIDKVVTIEASGIAPALYTAEALNVPLVFAKKSKNVTLNEELLTTEVFSFTKKVTSNVSISQKYLKANDKVLIVDDFLANGQAALGLCDILRKAHCEICGIAIVIEKSFQPGRQLLEKEGLKVSSLARVGNFEDEKIHFLEADDEKLEKIS